MTAITRPTGNVTRLPPLPIYRFSVDQYHRMTEAGILGEEDPVELLEGLIVVKGDSTLVPSIYVLKSPGSIVPQDLLLPIRRFSVDEYRRLHQAGILKEEDRVELLEGWIVAKMSRNPRHDAVITKLHNKLIGPLLPKDWFCRNQSAIQGDTTQPEPDLAVVRGAEFDYADRHPRPRDLALVIEVADTTLATDRALKGPLYARLGITASWIVNLSQAHVEVYTDPTGPDPDPSYQQRRDFGLAENVALLVAGQEVGHIPVREMLPG
jgi:hypothetical protein